MTRACSSCRYSVDNDCTNPNDVAGLEDWISENEVDGALVEGADRCPGWKGAPGGAKPPKSAIGNRLNAARIDRGLSWAQLAQQIGVPGAAISKIKDGRQRTGPALARCEAWLDSPPVEAPPALDLAPDGPEQPTPSPTATPGEEVPREGADVASGSAGWGVGGDEERPDLGARAVAELDSLRRALVHLVGPGEDAHLVEAVREATEQAETNLRAARNYSDVVVAVREVLDGAKVPMSGDLVSRVRWLVAEQRPPNLGSTEVDALRHALEDVRREREADGALVDQFLDAASAPTGWPRLFRLGWLLADVEIAR